MTGHILTHNICVWCR